MKRYYRLPLLALLGSLLAGTLAAVPVYAYSTQVTQLINPGLLALTGPTSATMGSTLTTFNSSNTTSGSLGTVEVDDARGSYVGWSLTATASNFTHIGQAIQTGGSIPTSLSTGGSYNSATAGIYTVTITQAGNPGVAQFSVSGLETAAAATIPSGAIDVSLGTHGVLVDFPNTAYQVGESWKIPISLIPVSNLTLQPSAATTTARYGDLTGVHTGSGHTFSSTADSATILSADFGEGFGAYLTTPSLNLQIPPLTPSGFYFSTITETLD